jgi:uncharacterized protein (DUF58 family)
MQRILRRLTPFVLIGCAVVIFAFGIMLLAYLLWFGVLLGLALFSLSYIRNKFFAPPQKVVRKTRKGRVIDSDQWRKL